MKEIDIVSVVDECVPTHTGARGDADSAVEVAVERPSSDTSANDRQGEVEKQQRRRYSACGIRHGCKSRMGPAGRRMQMAGKIRSERWSVDQVDQARRRRDG